MLRFGVHFWGCGVAASAALFVYLSSFCQRAAEDVLRRMLGPSLETDAIFDAVLSVNYCADCDSVSVMAVREKCDERVGSSSTAAHLSKPRKVGHPQLQLCRQCLKTKVGQPRWVYLNRTMAARFVKGRERA